MVYVLRPKHEAVFDLIGDVYIHGVTDGQCFEDGSFDLQDQETIILE